MAVISKAIKAHAKFAPKNQIPTSEDPDALPFLMAVEACKTMNAMLAKKARRTIGSSVPIR
eukprot:4981495-Amphidinium_carterae.1